jgi:bifunctional aspartokinase / homoserine dehydrogenase 1
MPALVLKFGGTSALKSPQSIIKIVRKKSKNNKIFIVLSALSGVTNLLHKLYNEVNMNDQIIIIKKIKEIHKKFTSNIKFKNPSKLNKDLCFIYNSLENIIFSKNLKKGYKTKNIVITFGEKLSITIYHYLLSEFGLSNTLIWSESLITTNNNYKEAFPLLDKCKINIETIKKRFTKNIIITSGYTARSIEGHKTTLGRNGSDFTATILASTLNIKTVEIYSDVDGVLTCDPRKVKTAILIPKLNYKQISEMCYFGASVLHPKTLIPLKGKNIDLYMKNTFKRNLIGTHIVENCITINEIDAVTSITNNSLITIKGKGMLGVCGISYKVFKILVDNDISTSFITQASSEQNLCLSINNEYINKVYNKLLNIFKDEIELGQIDKIQMDKNIAIVTVIGNNMNNRVGIAGKIFTVLGENDINIIAISQGTSELSISFVIKKEDESKALNALHEKFIE